MTTESVWKVLKHQDLPKRRPPQDQLVHVLLTQTVERAIATLQELTEARSQERRAPPLQRTQADLKQEWKRLHQMSGVTRLEGTDLKTFTCPCGAQQYSPWLLCVHLVQALQLPAPTVWERLIRRRTTPFYYHPSLLPVDGSVLPPLPLERRCIDFGDEGSTARKVTKAVEEMVDEEMREANGEPAAVLEGMVEQRTGGRGEAEEEPNEDAEEQAHMVSPVALSMTLSLTEMMHGQTWEELNHLFSRAAWFASGTSEGQADRDRAARTVQRVNPKMVKELTRFVGACETDLRRRREPATNGRVAAATQFMHLRPYPGPAAE